MPLGDHEVQGAQRSHRVDESGANGRRIARVVSGKVEQAPGLDKVRLEQVHEYLAVLVCITHAYLGAVPRNLIDISVTAYNCK